jgi:hypothetical protein
MLLLFVFGVRILVLLSSFFRCLDELLVLFSYLVTILFWMIGVFLGKCI